MSANPKEERIEKPEETRANPSEKPTANSPMRRMPILQADAPITQSSEDKLNRTSLAKGIARAISNIDAKDSLVIGVYGGWGTGKTSLLNLLEEQLEIESKQPPLIMRFNPWDFSSQEQLTTQFFRELSVFLRLHETIPTLSRIADTVDQYGRLLSPVARVLAPHTTEITKVAWSLFKKWGPKTIRTTIDLKAEINSALATLDHKLIILVDDIDRLNTAEIRQTFQLIKLNANFSNTVYVTAFKKEAVEHSLKDVSPGAPGEYLEKIVQVPFTLPAITGAKLGEFIINNFNKTLASFPVPNLDQQRFGNMFNSGFIDYFQTLRDVTRYFNSFRFALAMIGDDTNFIDLAAVQVLALFENELYLAIEANADLFLESERSEFASKEDVGKKFGQLFDSLRVKNNIEAAKEVCSFLFPRFASQRVTFGSDWEMQWEKDRRVCSSRYFPFFFQLAVPEGEVSNAEMSRILEECTSVEQFVKELATINSSGRFSVFVDTLRHRISGLDEAKLKIILNSIFVCGDEVSLEGTGFLSFISDHLRFTSWLLLDVLGQLGDHRYNDLIEAMTGSRAVYTVASVASTFQHALAERGKGVNEFTLKEKFPNLTPEIVDRSKSIAVDVIEASARNHELDSAPGLPSLLYRWREWGSKEAMEAYLNLTFLRDAHSAAAFITKFIHRTQSISVQDKVPKSKNRLLLKDLSEFVDLERLNKLVRASVDSELSPDEVEAKRLFLRGMDQLHSGKSLESIGNPLSFDED